MRNPAKTICRVTHHGSRMTLVLKRLLQLEAQTPGVRREVDTIVDPIDAKGQSGGEDAAGADRVSMVGAISGRAFCPAEKGPLRQGGRMVQGIYIERAKIS